MSEREQLIIDALKKGPVKYNLLRKKVDIPKASFSRHIRNLEKKNIVIREGDGRNKLIKLRSI